MSRNPRFAESSDHGASGPGGMRSRWPRSANALAIAGGIASARPYATGLSTPATHRMSAGARRMVPSAPRMMPYGPKRPLPESVPRVRCWNA